MDVDLAKGLGLHMILIWGRVALVQGVPIVFKFNSILIIVCSLLLLLYYFYVFFIKYKCIPKMNQGAIFVGVFVLLTLLFTVVVWPQNVQYMDPIGNTLFYEIIPFMIICMISNMESLYEPMVSSSRILVILCAISAIGIVFVGHTTVSEWSSYNMPLSYATLYAVMWLMMDYFKNKRTLSLLLFIVGIMIILIVGSRNPLLSIAAYIVYEIFMGRKNNIKLLLMILSVALLLFWNQILKAIKSFTEIIGISSRTLTILMDQNYFSDDRIGIHQRIFQVLNNHPFGVGIAGDLANIHEFAHSLYVSVLCTYGYIIGALVIVLLGVVLLKAYKKSNGMTRDILVLYVLMVLPRGFTGGDIWSSDVFWWMMGIAITIIYMKSNSQQIVSNAISISED